MFKFQNNTFHVTRGDRGSFTIAYRDGSNLPEGATVSFRVYRREELDSDPVIFLDDDIPANAKSFDIEVWANPEKFDNPENDREEYWYELKVGLENTVLGYDETGAKIFYLYPTGKDGK